MAILEFKPMEKEPKKPEKMSIIELLDQMAEQMLDFVAHYYDDFLTDGIYQAIWPSPSTGARQRALTPACVPSPPTAR